MNIAKQIPLLSCLLKKNEKKVNKLFVFRKNIANFALSNLMLQNVSSFDLH